MLLPLVFAVVAPPSFVQAVEARIATSHMHVVDWWADDLDGDHVPEAIAFVCEGDHGQYLVQHGNDLLEAPAQIDGRNDCPEAPAQPPVWRIAKAGKIQLTVNVHHGQLDYALAIREGRLALVGEGGDGFELVDGGRQFEATGIDYDKLTWRQRVEAPNASVRQRSGPLVLVTDQVRRPTKLIGATTLAAIGDRDATTLHVHADRALVLRDCDETPCKTTRLAKGDHELAVTAPNELAVVVGKATFAVHFAPVGGMGYPPPPPSPM